MLGSLLKIDYFLKVIISPLLAHLSNGCFLFVLRKLSYSSSVERRLNKLAFAIDNVVIVGYTNFVTPLPPTLDIAHVCSQVRRCPWPQLPSPRIIRDFGLLFL